MAEDRALEDFDGSAVRGGRTRTCGVPSAVLSLTEDIHALSWILNVPGMPSAGVETEPAEEI